jgi:hypothetical protein
VDFKMKFDSKGEITGDGVDPNNGEDPRNVEVFGYHYLQNMAIIVTSQDDSQSYMFAGTSDLDRDEIYGRWWLASD